MRCGICRKKWRKEGRHEGEPLVYSRYHCFSGVDVCDRVPSAKEVCLEPTFSHYDKQPFGCAVFDSLLSSSLPKGYSLSRKTFYELEQEDTTLRRGILVVTDNLHLTDVDVEAMLKMAGRGRPDYAGGGALSAVF